MDEVMLPPGSLAWGQTKVESWQPLPKGLWQLVSLTLWQTTVNLHLHTHGQVWLSLLWGHCSFLLGPGAQGFISSLCFPSPAEAVCANPTGLQGQIRCGLSVPLLEPLVGKAELLQQCKNFFGIIVLRSVGHLLSGFTFGLMATSSKRIYAVHCASQVCCSQSPCPRCRPRLTGASAGDTQRFSLLWGSLLPFPGSWWHKVWFAPSECLWQVWGLILNAIAPLLPSCCNFSFAFGHRVYFGGFQHSPVDDYSTASCDFGVFTGEDEHTSFYSAKCSFTPPLNPRALKNYAKSTLCVLYQWNNKT